MAERRIGIIVNGATGRMGYRQHLVRSLLAIRDQGGVELEGGDERIDELRVVLEESEADLRDRAAVLTDLRRRAADGFAAAVAEEPVARSSKPKRDRFSSTQ